MEPPIGLVVGNKFRVYEKIGKSSSGDIYIGTDVETNELVAIKLENVEVRIPRLRYETWLYRVLRDGIPFTAWIPKTRWFGVDGENNVLVMDLLGPNLESLFTFCGRQLSLKTVLSLAVQMISCVEFVHSKSIFHGDISPYNFHMGLGRCVHQVYIVNFGKARKYIDPSTHQHIPYREQKMLAGTVRFASVNNHRGIEQSRRDDLESLGYLLMYFLRGSLPWQGLNAASKEEKYQMILDRKASTSTEALCDGYPTEFVSYINYCRSLGFDEMPDYAYLKGIFRGLFIREGFQGDNVWDWNIRG